MSQPLIELLDQITQMQKKKLLELGRIFVPTLTEEDVLQPMDYPQLEHNPAFRYEEGVLEGIHTVRSALLAYFNETSPNRD